MLDAGQSGAVAGASLTGLICCFVSASNYDKAFTPLGIAYSIYKLAAGQLSPKAVREFEANHKEHLVRQWLGCCTATFSLCNRCPNRVSCYGSNTPLNTFSRRLHNLAERQATAISLPPFGPALVPGDENLPGNKFSILDACKNHLTIYLRQTKAYDTLLHQKYRDMIKARFKDTEDLNTAIKENHDKILRAIHFHPDRNDPFVSFLEDVIAPTYAEAEHKANADLEFMRWAFQVSESIDAGEKPFGEDGEAALSLPSMAPSSQSLGSPAQPPVATPMTRLPERSVAPSVSEDDPDEGTSLLRNHPRGHGAARQPYHPMIGEKDSYDLRASDRRVRAANGETV